MEAWLLSQLHHLVEHHLLGHAQLCAALLHVNRAGDLIGDDGYRTNHLADKVGTTDGIALRLVKQKPGFKPDEIGLVILQVLPELLVGRFLGV